MEHKEESFTYTYSAKEQAEVERIRKKYLPKEEDKMEQLRRLDSIPYHRATAWSIVLGVIGALILGTGMSLCMTNLAEVLGRTAMVIGVIVGFAGMVLMALAYPVYNRILRKERKRIAPEVLRLTDELMK